MPERQYKISFVSGKGGVGKTFLAVNFAWICGHFAKTLLVDLDIQNQGATGLLSSFIHEDSSGAVDHILKSEQRQQSAFLKLDGSLYFLPAVPLNNPPKHSDLFDACQAPDFRLKLRSFLDKVFISHGFEIVIMDCHGGLDMVSLAAHRLSSHTLMVTEPDRVTFNGTLELLDFYQTAETSMAVAATNSGPTIRSNATVQQEVAGPVQLIVNRVPPKYRWSDLNRVYEGELSTYQSQLNISDKILLYIPAEELVADAFGEIPFLVPVAPNSVAAQKLHLLAYRLFGDDFEFPGAYKPLKRFISPRRERKVERTLISAENYNIRAIVATFAAMSCAYVFLFLGSISFSVLAETEGWSLSRETKDVIYGAVCLFISFVSAVYLKAVFGLQRYYKDKYQVQRNLQKVEHAEISLWQKISIVRLLLLRAAMVVLPYVVILTVLVFILGGVAGLKHW